MKEELINIINQLKLSLVEVEHKVDYDADYDYNSGYQDGLLKAINIIEQYA